MTRCAPLFLLLLLAACAPGLSSCGGDAEDERLHIAGTITKVDMEGGFFGILGQDGKQYEPANLPEDFMADGLPVEVKAVPLRDAVSFRQWGQPIIIDEITRR